MLLLLLSVLFLLVVLFEKKKEKRDNHLPKGLVFVKFSKNKVFCCCYNKQNTTKQNKTNKKIGVFVCL